MYILCKHGSKLLDLSNGFAVLSWSIFITTEGFKLLNRANGSALGSLALRSTEVNKEVSDETGETVQCCRTKEVGSLN